MNDNDRKFFFELFKEFRQQARHYQNQRSVVSGLVFTLSAAIFAVAGFDDQLNKSDLPLLVFQLFVSLFGMLFCLKYQERYGYHRKLALNALKRSNHELFKEAVTDPTSEYQQSRRLSRFRVWPLWILIHLIAAGISLFLIVSVLIASK